MSRAECERGDGESGKHLLLRNYRSLRSAATATLRRSLPRCGVRGRRWFPEPALRHLEFLHTDLQSRAVRNPLGDELTDRYLSASVGAGVGTSTRSSSTATQAFILEICTVGSPYEKGILGLITGYDAVSTFHRRTSHVARHSKLTSPSSFGREQFRTATSTRHEPSRMSAGTPAEETWSHGTIAFIDPLPHRVIYEKGIDQE